LPTFGAVSAENHGATVGFAGKMNTCATILYPISTLFDTVLKYPVIESRVKRGFPGPALN